MFIEPNTIIKILKDVPLDNTYEHTIWWENSNTGKASQAAYFLTKTKYTLDHQSYQRLQRGYMRIYKQAEDLYDCNYLMYKNQAFGDRWFYAFITKVEYVNNNVSQVEFEIDEMQTWYFDYELKECFVEREHSTTDQPGDNLVPENLEHGEYVAKDYRFPQCLAPLSIIVAATFDNNWADYGGERYGGIFAGLYYHVFSNDATGTAALKTFIEQATVRTLSDGIVSIFLAPERFLLTPASTATKWVDWVIDYHEDGTGQLSTGQTFDGYIPRNKKLLTYPYNFLYVTNQQGQAATFPFEYFAPQTGQTWGYANFAISCDWTPNPTPILVPLWYKGVGLGDSSGRNFDEAMTLSGYPQCAYNIDLFKAWLAQGTISWLGNAVSTLGGGILSSAMSLSLDPLRSAPGSILRDTLNTVTEGIKREIQPPQARGQQSGSVLASVDMLNFLATRKHITYQFAEMIDQFFDKYGYATHRVKVPNTHARLHWTYTKTIGCVMTGSVPADSADKICSIYNNGITFWVTPSEIGDYSDYARFNTPVVSS